MEVNGKLFSGLRRLREVALFQRISLFGFGVSGSGGRSSMSTSPFRIRRSISEAHLSTKIFRIDFRQSIGKKFYSNPGKFKMDATAALRKRSTIYYLAALGVIVVGGSYAAVPLYRIFCASYSYGGTLSIHGNDKDLSLLRRIQNREITIKFFADRSSSMQWNFHPQQPEIIVTPGETALAFYRAENKTNRPIDGISTYNVLPFEAGQYFNKIQCFCFEEQRLNPGETVELPVFFYIDPEFVEDPKMENVDLITLSYTFFESKDMPNLNLPFNWTGHGKTGDNSIDNSAATVVSNSSSPTSSANVAIDNDKSTDVKK